MVELLFILIVLFIFKGRRRKKEVAWGLECIDEEGNVTFNMSGRTFTVVRSITVPANTPFGTEFFVADEDEIYDHTRYFVSVIPVQVGSLLPYPQPYLVTSIVQGKQRTYLMHRGSPDYFGDINTNKYAYTALIHRVDV